MAQRNAILAVLLLVSAGCSLAQDELRVATRFGTFTIGTNKEVLFRGHPLEPSIVGNSGIDIGAPTRIADADAVLVTNIGGTACPYLYSFVTVTKSGARATKSFGTCNQVIEVNKAGDSIRVTMHGFQGPFEPEAARKKAFREVHVFVYQNGLVKEEKLAPK